MKGIQNEDQVGGKSKIKKLDLEDSNMSDSSEMNSSNSDDAVAGNQASSPSAEKVEEAKLDILGKLKNALVTEKKAAENPKAYQDNGRNYKSKITSFLQNEKEALAKEAKFRGVEEKHVYEYLE